jgi:GNAT superfamily N-acetyltransferase
VIVSITIRLADLSDTDNIAVMNKQLIEDEKHENPMTIPQLRERMNGFVTGDYIALLLCADSQDNIIGYALINKAAQPFYLRQFFICRSERRKGYGKQFFQKILDYLKTDTIDVEVMVWNEIGKAFWDSLQFKPRSIYMRYRDEDE